MLTEKWLIIDKSNSVLVNYWQKKGVINKTNIKITNPDKGKSKENNKGKINGKKN